MIPPTTARLAQAEQTALNLLLDAGITKPPVCAKSLLGRQAVVHLFRDAYEEAFCDLEKGRRHAYLNRRLRPGHDNFACGHELGHLEMGHFKINPALLTPVVARLLKREANYFSAILIMPAEWIREYIKEHGLNSLEDLIDLAEAFNAPCEAMERRLVELSICDRKFIDWLWTEN